MERVPDWEKMFDREEESDVVPVNETSEPPETSNEPELTMSNYDTGKPVILGRGPSTGDIETRDLMVKMKNLSEQLTQLSRHTVVEKEPEEADEAVETVENGVPGSALLSACFAPSL